MARKKKKSVVILKNPLDFTLLITVFILLGLGIITVLSASSPTALAETGNSYKYVGKQIFSAIIGIILMFTLSKVDYKIWQRKYMLIYLVCIVLLISVVIAGAAAGGATRWLDLGFISFQPSEVAKIGIIIFYSALLTRNRDKLKSITDGFFKPLLWLLPIIGIVLILQNHFSATLVLCALAVILMLLAGCSRNISIIIQRSRIQTSKIYNFLRSMARCIRRWLANYPKSICYWFRRIIWCRTRRK